jgi:hypothetical protein
MGFLAPWFLAGAVLAGIPIYLHLLRRHKTDPQPFSSLMFFERRIQSSIKHRRLRHLLLLSLRVAILLLLALLFANPFLRRPVASLGGNKLMLLVIDDSFSMRAGSRLADAKKAALALLASRHVADRTQVMTLGSGLHALTQQTQEPGELRAAVEGITPGDSRASFGDLARGLRSLAEAAHAPVEVHLFSDFQKSQMPASFQEMVLPPNVTLVPHRVSKQADPNWAVESVTAPGQVWDPKTTRVEGVVVGYHTQAATRILSLVASGKTLATRTVNVPAGGRARFSFDSLEVPYGFSRCEVRIDSADALSADDHFLFSVERSDPRRVLLIHEAGDTRSPLYFRSALASAAEAAFTVDAVTPERASGTPPSQYAFVVLSDVMSLPSAYEATLVNYVWNGGSVLVTLGTSAAERPRIPIFGGHILRTHYYARDGERFLTVGETDSTHPSIAKAGHWADVDFYFAAEPDAADSRVIARLTDGTPLLLEKQLSEGRVLLFTSGLDNLTNDFPLHPIFVPFIEQTARYLSGTERRSGSRLVGSYFELRRDKDRAASVEVVDPEGRRPLSLEAAAATKTFQLNDAGFYEMRLANGRHEVIGVNADRRESDLDVIPDDVLAVWRGQNTPAPAQASTAGEVREQTKPQSLWRYFMLLLLLAALAESVLSDRYLGTLREEP